MPSDHDFGPFSILRVDLETGEHFYAGVEAPDALTAIQVLLTVIKTTNMRAPRPLVLRGARAMKQGGDGGMHIYLRRTEGPGYQPADPAAIEEANAFGVVAMPFVGSIYCGEEVWKLFGLSQEFEVSKAAAQIDIAAENAWRSGGPGTGAPRFGPNTGEREAAP